MSDYTLEDAKRDLDRLAREAAVYYDDWSEYVTGLHDAIKGYAEAATKRADDLAAENERLHKRCDDIEAGRMITCSACGESYAQVATFTEWARAEAATKRVEVTEAALLVADKLATMMERFDMEFGVYPATAGLTAEYRAAREAVEREEEAR